MNARTFNREASRWAEERAALADDSRTLARVQRLLGAQPDHVVSAVQRVLGDRQRLILALEDALHRMASDRDALGFGESSESRNARFLLEELRSTLPQAPRSPEGPGCSGIPSDAAPRGGAA